MIWRNLHPICTACWDVVVGVERWKTRDLHHFFTYNAHPACCWCGHPSHGQWWKMPRLEVPCKGMFGFHADQPNVVDLDVIKQKYPDDDEIKALIAIAKGLQDELAQYEKGA